MSLLCSRKILSDGLKMKAEFSKFLALCENKDFFFSPKSSRTVMEIDMRRDERMVIV